MGTTVLVRASALIALALTLALVREPAPVAAGGGCRGVPVTEQAGDSVAMHDSCFEPSILHVEPGQQVTWNNKSSQPHSVSGQNSSWGDYEEHRTSESVSHTFEKPGTYAYFCFVHNGMLGVIVVGDGKGGVSHAGQPDEVFASVSEEQGDETTAVVQPAVTVSAAAAAAADDDGSSWWTLAGVAMVAAIAGGGAVAVARRR